MRNGVTAVHQIDLKRIPLNAGLFYAALTVDRQGGVGGKDVISGTLDATQNPPRFTKSTDVDALNSALDENHITISNDLLVCVVVRSPRAFFAQRSRRDVPFPALVPVLPLGNYTEAALGRHDGNETLSFSLGQEVHVEFAGKLGLDPSTVHVLPAIGIQSFAGVGDLALPVPSGTPSLMAGAQAIAMNLTTGRIYFSNTACVFVD